MPTGEELRDKGIDYALQGVSLSWKDQYALLIDVWFKHLPKGATFTGEAMRIHALRNGLHEPVHPNAWGGVAFGFIRALLISGDIERVGMAKALSLKAHARQYPAYRKL